MATWRASTGTACLMGVVMLFGACGTQSAPLGVAETGGSSADEDLAYADANKTASDDPGDADSTGTADGEAASNDEPAAPAGPITYDLGGAAEAVLALSDGRVAAATSDWARLRVWHPDDESITPVEFLEVHATSSIWSLAELPDGRIVSAGADDWAVRVWNPAEPTAEPVLYDGHTGLVSAVAVLPDGRVASAGRDNDATVHVWDPDAPTDSVLVLSGHSLAVNDVAVLDDGRLVSADWGGSVYFWDLADPSAPTATFTDPSVDDSEPGHIGTDTITQLADGRLALGSLGGIVRILDPDSLDGSTVFTDLGTVRDVVALDDGRLAWGGDQNTVTVQDPNQPAGTGVIYDAHTFSVSGLDALADGRIVSGSWDGTVRIWHPDTL